MTILIIILCCNYEFKFQEIKTIKLLIDASKILLLVGISFLTYIYSNFKILIICINNQIYLQVELGKKIQNHYQFPQNVKWTINNDKIHILESRPITTLLIKTEERTEKDAQKTTILIKGLEASPGIADGTVKIIKKIDELDKVQKGDILVTSMTTPDMVPAMKRANGIITDKGGITCHAAIVSRELGIPCVVGTKNATKILQENSEVIINSENPGIIRNQPKKAKITNNPKKPLINSTIKVDVRISILSNFVIKLGSRIPYKIA